MCHFFATPSHRGPCPLKEILFSFLTFWIYAFISSSQKAGLHYLLSLTGVIHEGIEVEDIAPLSLNTPSNSCCQQSLWGWLDKINWNFQINLTYLIGETSETSNIKQTGKSKCVLFADRVHNALVEFWNNDKVIISHWRASLLPTVSRYCHFHPNYDDDDVQGVQRWRNGSSRSQTRVGLPSPAWTTKDRRDTMDHSVKAITNHRKVNPAFEWKSALFGPF